MIIYPWNGIVLSIALSSLLSFLITMYTFFVDIYLRTLYRLGLLQRTTRLPDGTEFIGTFISEFIVVSPSFIALALNGSQHHLDVSNGSFNAMSCLVYTLTLALIKDALFYHVHRWMHIDKRFYRWAHSTHHDHYPGDVLIFGDKKKYYYTSFSQLGLLSQ